MDVYRRGRREWVARSRGDAEELEGGSGFVGFPDDEAAAGEAKGREKEKSKKARHLTALEKARERHGRDRAKKEKAARQEATAVTTA